MTQIPTIRQTTVLRFFQMGLEENQVHAITYLFISTSMVLFPLDTCWGSDNGLLASTDFSLMSKEPKPCDKGGLMTVVFCAFAAFCAFFTTVATKGCFRPWHLKQYTENGMGENILQWILRGFVKMDAVGFVSETTDKRGLNWEFGDEIWKSWDPYTWLKMIR